VARDWTRKGGDLALATVERLRDEGVSCDLTVVGDGPDLPAWVHRTGRLGREEVGPLYAAHDVLLETARANAGGVTLTDAAASGLPVVATRTGGVPSIVEDGVTGILVDPSRVVPEAVRAVSWLADPHHWSQFSDAALRRSRDELSWSRWAETAVDLCANVVDRH
jgi:glycosyltransferase involved in cell wall biosynthesis